MKKLLFSLLAVFCLAACSDDDDAPQQLGPNYIDLSTESATTFNEDSEVPVEVTVTLARPVAAPATVNIELTNNEDGILSIDHPAVKFAANEQVKSFKIVSNKKEALIEKRTIGVRVKDYTDPSMSTMKDGFDLIVNPAATMPEISEEQSALLDGYKENLGIDVRRMLGKLNCKVKITYPVDEVGAEGESAFSETEVQEYSTQTVVTLSDKATAEKPVLNMIDNPLGLTSVFHKVLNKAISVDNRVGTCYPSVAEVLKFDEKTETFSMSLDSLAIENDGNVTFLQKYMDEYEEEAHKIPFVFRYSAWDRQLQMAKDGVLVDIESRNPDNLDEIWDSAPETPMQEVIDTWSITFDPYKYVGTFDPFVNSWETDIFKAPLGRYDLVNGTMNFRFCWEHAYSADWTIVEVSYSLR